MTVTTVRTWRGLAPRRRTVQERRLDLRLLAPVAVAWLLTAFVGLLVDVRLVWVGSVLALLLAVLLARAIVVPRRRALPPGRRPHPPGATRRLVALTLALTALLLLAAGAQRTIRTAGPVEDLARSGAVVTMVGSLAADPRPVAASSNRGGPVVVVRIAVDTVVGRGVRTPVSTPVLVVGPASAWGALRWNDAVEVVARLAPAEPGDDVVAVGRPLGAPRVLGGPGPVLEAAEGVRGRFRTATDDVWADARGLVPALVVGDTSRTPQDLTEAMLATGLSHVSAVSGTNVTLVVAAAVWACGLLGIRRQWRPLVAVLVLAAFVTVARPEPSVIRAAVMGAVGLLALSTSRRRAGVPVLGGAVVTLLVWDPWLARSYGFALSAAATLGLLVLVRPWGATIASGLPRRLGWLGPVIAVPLAAQAVCAPLVVPLQGSVSVIAVVANLLAAPFVAPATIAGVVVAVLAVLWPWAAATVAWAAAAPAQAIAWVARRCAEAPVVSIPWGESAWHAVGLAVLTVAAIVTIPWAWHRGRTRPSVAAAVVLVTIGMSAPTRPVAWPPPGWLLVACDVGQGDGLVVNSGPGRAVVIDAGPDPALISRCLQRLRIQAVDLVVLTHFHADHVDGLAGVLAEWPVAEIRSSPVRDPPGEAEVVARVASARHARVGELRAGQHLEVGAVAADVWWPARQIEAGSVANNGSVVLTLHVGGVGFLLAGDIEREAAAAVLREVRADPHRWGQVDVLKVAHHGSGNRDDRLLDHIAGRLALISVGADNDYGHPTPSTLAALDARGFEVHRTDLEGDLAVVSRDGQLVVVSP
ncbi:MAG TPA: ComEC/Rec2 family competence protein [Humibacillus xanthopallidus]|nr:ComEC/Rec2 family competence protein [Humibacillus xanthopallidus]